jgi:hypothetical protein
LYHPVRSDFPKFKQLTVAHAFVFRGLYLFELSVVLTFIFQVRAVLSGRLLLIFAQAGEGARIFLCLRDTQDLRRRGFGGSRKDEVASALAGVGEVESENRWEQQECEFHF